MTIKVEINKDSVGPNGVRLTTFVLTYPRFFHSEFLTHRAFSRNASSSRAIPFEKQMKMIEEDMALPLEFRKNQKGMQAGEALDQAGQWAAESEWRQAGVQAISFAKTLSALGVHKQYVNRLVEPFAHITVVVSATEFANFFALRHHHMAQPEIAELAKQMWNQYSANEPQKLAVGDWHLPFVSKEEIKAQWDSIVDMSAAYTDALWHEAMWLPLIKMSVARCARVSYLNHDGTKSSFEQDCALYNRLLADQPIHASPAEHQAQAIEKINSVNPITGNIEWWSGNFRCWRQYRQQLPGQNITHFKGPLK